MKPVGVVLVLEVQLILLKITLCNVLGVYHYTRGTTDDDDDDDDDEI